MDTQAATKNPLTTALISIEDWAAIQETLYLLSIPGMRDSVLAGLRESLLRGSSELSW